MNTAPPVPLRGFVQVKRFGPPRPRARRCPLCGWLLADQYDGEWCRCCYMGLDEGEESDDARFDKMANVG